ncbi:hypothetical protein CEQ51_16460 [Pseudomonas thivervalensis]|uniref:Uncharacterized protein n=2 Tax=Pseudomonas thivervalensis TaxID=86265 RepID=A0A2Z4ZWF2_9PSED|nr:hypothetical protein CE140_15905 [Pseudomonas thivervalensis]AXA61601.1 hypothetical protein CEQ51_16460 [Pseudomonas thivervalensis]
MRCPDLMTAWLLAVLGKKLLSVNAIFHVFASRRDSFPQEVSFQFYGSEAGKLYGGGDGSSLLFSLDPIVGCDLGKYGRQDVFCVSGEPYFLNVVEEKLLSASLVQSSVAEAVIGVALSFDGGSCLSVLNLGDELFVYDEIPVEIMRSEGLDLISVS